MKKISIGFLILLSKILLLILPLFLSFHAAHSMGMSEHNSSQNTGCIEHCMSDIILHHNSEIISYSQGIEIIFYKIVYQIQSFHFSISLWSIFLLVGLSPPFQRNIIKNYHFGLLKKIIVANT